MRHINIPVFIPHLGCPCRCVFCDQQSISGQTAPGESESDILPRAKKTVEAILSSIRRQEGATDVEIAFFGGSFTAIPRALMISLLNMAKGYLDRGDITGIRLSTRPDCLDDEILDILAAYGAFDVELGVQSLSDEVLALSGRGHSAADSLDAIARMHKRGNFRPVGQMMLGLPGSTPEIEEETAKRLCEAGISGARIYPTAVLRGSALQAMYEKGEYTPLTVEEAAKRAAAVLQILREKRIPCLRIGLCAEEGLEKDAVLGGGYHPALGEMAWGLFYRARIEAALPAELPKDARLHIFVPRGRSSAAAGYQKSNRLYFTEKYRLSAYRIREDSSLPEEEARVETLPYI